MNTSMRVTRHFAEGPYGQVHYRMAGSRDSEKPPVICLHMSPKSGRSFEDLLPFLAKDRLVIAPDNPGHGESDLPPAEPAITLEDYARSMWVVVDSLVTVPVHLLGFHTGSMVAVEAASQCSDKVLSVINIGAPVFTAKEQARMVREYDTIPIDEEGKRFTIMWERVLMHRGPGMTLQMAADSFAENLRAGDAYEWGHRAAFAYVPSYNRKLTEIAQPLLVVNPMDDCYEQSKRADELWNNGRRIDKREWGHGFLNAYPQDAADLFLSFIEEVE